MRMFQFVLFLGAIGATWGAGAATVEAADTEAMKAWMAAGLDQEKVTAPFSFTYGGRSSAELLPDWTLTRAQTLVPGGSGLLMTWTCPKTGLQVRLEGVVYADFPVVEWTLHLRNTGTTDTPILEEVQALNILVPTANGDPRLRYAKGGTCSFEDFRPMERVLNKGGRAHFQPGGGRSSSDYLPFFNLEYQPQKMLDRGDRLVR